MADRGLNDFSTPVPLGRGGMGLVYRATHLPSGAEVALKRLPDGANEVLHSAFRREIEVVARIDHPHVIDLLAAGVCEQDEPFPPGTPWIAMELARGSVLDRAPTCWAEVRDVALAVLSGLAVVHAHDVLHRDLTPANVLDTGTVRFPHWRLADFGLAMLDGRGLRGGTSGFRAPERGGAEGPWTDLFSVGCLVWWMVHDGRTPEEGAYGPAMDVPPGLVEWLDVSLAPHTRDRFLHARSARLALDTLGTPVARARRHPSHQRDTRRTWLEDDTATPLTVPLLPVPSLPADWREITALDTRTPPFAELRARLQDAHSPLLPCRPPPIVGRSDACDALWAHVVEVARGEGRTVLLSGLRCSGTTRLLEWLIRTTRATGAPISLQLRDRGEPPGDEPGPGTLRVVVDPLPGAAVVHLQPLDRAVFEQLWRSLMWRPIGRAPTPAEVHWLRWLCLGLPGRLMEILPRLRDVDWRSDGRGPIHLVPTTPEAREEAARLPIEERERRGRRWLDERSGDLDAACYVLSPPDARRRWHAGLAACCPRMDPDWGIHAALAGQMELVWESFPTLFLDLPVLFVDSDDPEVRAAAHDWRAGEYARPPLARVIRAGWLNKYGSLPEHTRWVDDLVRDPDTHPQHLAIAARALARTGRTAEARDVVGMALERHQPDHIYFSVDPRWVAGWIAMLANDLDAAERWFAMAPFRPANELGEIARLRGDVEEALRWYEIAVVERGRLDAQINLVELFVDTERYDAATRELARLRWRSELRELPFIRCAVELVAAALAERIGDTVALDRSLDELLTLSPGDLKGDPSFRRHSDRLAKRLDDGGDTERAALVRSLAAHW